MAKNTKTNVMRLLEQHEIEYLPHFFNKKKDKNASLDTPIFKTLVTIGKSNTHYVFVIPVTNELDLKKAANVANEKSIHMIKEKELLPLTGYVHGGCSPIGMKKQYQTFVDQSALKHKTIIFSAGKVHYSVEMNPHDLEKMIPVEFVDVIQMKG